MTFQPVVAGTGLVGWRFLQRTYDAQFEAFSKSAQIERDSEYFLKNIAKVTSATELVNDRRLLSVALGAFGLQEDINNRYFVQRILADGTASDDALANKLSDDRYKKLSQAFGFGPGSVPLTGLSGRMTDLVTQNKINSFEVAVGQTDNTMRIAMYANRKLEHLARENISEEARWFTLMGLPPIREMFETALGLPSGFGSVDIDKQLEIFQEKTRSLTGDETVAQFTKPKAVEKMTNLYLVRSQIANFNALTSSSANALQLLQFAG